MTSLFVKSKLFWITWKDITFFFFLNFLCRELWHLLDLLWLSFWPNFKIYWEMGFLSSSERVRHERSVTLPQMSHGAAILRNYSAKVKISYHKALGRRWKTWSEDVHFNGVVPTGQWFT